MHELFLCRLASHPVLRSNHNFRVFLEYEKEVRISFFFVESMTVIVSYVQLNVRGKNKKEIFSGFLRTITKTADESLLLSGQKVYIYIAILNVQIRFC